jgi:hypothetical protein
MPTAAAEKPKCQPTFSPRKPHTIGEKNAPRLIPM